MATTAWRLALQAARVVWPEFDRAASNGFIGHDNSSFEQHFFDQAKAQRKSEIQPHGMGDDLGGER
jgi:hypothetical protein